ncbi:hypothetical protein WMW72_11775 [Paenibacillus filicis]|uniref:CobQ/CobB/MinD/ParA nucleotide binding domain-containing protein n=1 Tax=Paenibacillus filicis TaxID=669464 RepID=A0ABU9DI94_9BACL
MSRLQLVLLDTDEYFGDMLSVYLRTSEFAQRFELQRFTSREDGCRYLAEAREPLIALVHESWLPLPDEAFRLRAGCTLIVSETERLGGVLEYPVIFKYQPLNTLLASTASHYNEFSAEALLGGGVTKSQVIAVYAATGGSGKTVTAIHLAAQLAAEGEQVLCFSLEQLPSYAWYDAAGETGEPDDAFSRLLYYAKSRPELLTAKLEQAKHRHPQWRFDCIRPLRQTEEWGDMEPADLRSLLKAARQSGLYDRIIVDSDSSCAPVVMELLCETDLILWPVSDDGVQLRKTSDWIAALRKRNGEEARLVMDKVRFLHNRNTGARLNDFRAYAIAVSGQLPYVPEWKSMVRVESMLVRGFADDAVAIVRGGGSSER